MDNWNFVKVEKDRLLLVEGNDEKSLFEEILLKSGIDDLQVYDAGGKDRFPGRLEALLADARVRNVNIRSVGIERDADDDAAQAYRSVCNALKQNELVAPPQTEVLSSGSPRVAILILPGNKKAWCTGRHLLGLDLRSPRC